MTDQILFGAIAVEERFVTAEQLAAAVAEQKSSAQRQRIGEILVARGALTPDQVQIILDIQRIKVADRTESPQPGGLFGRLAVEAGFCAVDAVNACVRRQSELAAGRTRARIGQIMMQAGCLTHEQFAELLRRQEKFPLKCPGCGAWYFVDGLGEGTKLLCRACLRIVPIPILPGSNAYITEFIQREAGGQTAMRVPGEAGDRFGPFRVEAEMHRMPAAVEFRAVHQPSGRIVALRILHATRPPRPAELETFRRRAAALAKIVHPNIAELVDAGEAAGRPYVATEYIDGPTFASPPARSARAKADLLVFLEKVTRTTSFAHNRSMAHGQLRPAFIAIGHRFEPRVHGFGLADLLTSQPFLKPETAFSTPYTAPEVLHGGAVGPKADIYAIGVMIYETLSDSLPYPARMPSQLREQILAGNPRPLSASVPAAWRTICERATAPNPRRRYAAAGELADDMRCALDGRPLARRGALERFADALRALWRKNRG